MDGIQEDTDNKCHKMSKRVKDITGNRYGMLKVDSF